MIRRRFLRSIRRIVVDTLVIEPLINVLNRSIRRDVFAKYDGPYLFIVESASSDAISLLLVGISAVVLKGGLALSTGIEYKSEAEPSLVV